MKLSSTLVGTFVGCARPDPGLDESSPSESNDRPDGKESEGKAPVTEGNCSIPKVDGKPRSALGMLMDGGAEGDTAKLIPLETSPIFVNSPSRGFAGVLITRVPRAGSVDCIVRLVGRIIGFDKSEGAGNRVSGKFVGRLLGVDTPATADIRLSMLSGTPVEISALAKADDRFSRISSGTVVGDGKLPIVDNNAPD